MKYNLVYFGNETLAKAAEDVQTIDGRIIDLINSMYEVMRKHNGIGLAAPQVGENHRIIVVDTREKDGSPFALINPVIQEKSEQLCDYEEGCLSLPNIAAAISRPEEIVVTGISPEGKEVRIEAKDLLARVLQHEIDHLDGKLFIDHLEQWQRDELRFQLKKIKKLNKPEL